MSLDVARELGKTIGKTISEQQEIKSSLSPDEEYGLDTIFTQEHIIISGTLTLKKKVYKNDSFVIDHPVLGDIDSSTLKIDGGYIDGLPALTIPISVPISFSSSAAEIMYTAVY